MGLTESHSNKSLLQQNYKLIRRYTSQCYGDLTVIQHKQTKQYLALKQIITESQMVSKMIEKRQRLRHRNLVMLEKYWFCGDQSLCSNLRNIELLFQYYPKSLDQEVQERIEIGQSFSDWEIVKILTDSLDCLKYLEENGIVHLLGNMKALLFDANSKTVKIIENQQISLFSKQNSEINLIAMMDTKKLLPLHPDIEMKQCANNLISSYKIIFQNIFVLGLIALGLCFMRQPIQLGIFGKSCYNFDKIKKRLQQIRHKFPKAHQIISILLTERNTKKKYHQILCDVLEQRRSYTKQNDHGLRLNDLQPIEKSDLMKGGKKLSKLRQLQFGANVYTQ